MVKNFSDWEVDYSTTVWGARSRDFIFPALVGVPGSGSTEDARPRVRSSLVRKF